LPKVELAKPIRNGSPIFSHFRVPPCYKTTTRKQEEDDLYLTHISLLHGSNKAKEKEKELN
jgi:hypothetical protein